MNLGGPITGRRRSPIVAQKGAMGHCQTSRLALRLTLVHEIGPNRIRPCFPGHCLNWSGRIVDGVLAGLWNAMTCKTSAVTEPMVACRVSNL